MSNEPGRAEPQDLSTLRREPKSSADRVPLPRRNKLTRVIIPAVLVLAFLALLLWAGRGLLQREVEVHVIPVVTKAVGGAVGPGVTTQAAGWVEPDPFPYNVTALTEGVVSEVLVLDGERVEKGAVIARLIADDAKIALARAEANALSAKEDVAIAEARLTAAQTIWDEPVARTRDTLASAAELAAAEAEVIALGLSADAEDRRAEQAAETLRRAEIDLRSGATSQLEVERLQRELRSATAVAAAARSARATGVAKADAARAMATAAAESARLRVEERSELSQAKAALSKARAESARADADRSDAALRVDRLDVRAPVSGVVLHRLVEPGAMVPSRSFTAGEPHIVSLYDPSKLQVRTDVPLAEAAKVGVGTKARIVVEVLPDRVFEGEVSRLVNLADIQKNTIQFKVRIDAPAPELKPDMLARVQFLIPASGGAVDGAPRSAERAFAPERLLLADADGDEVAWVAVPNGSGSGSHAERRLVTRGKWKTDGWVEIESGLRPGDQLIDGSAETLSEGRALKVLGENASDGGSGR